MPHQGRPKEPTVDRIHAGIMLRFSAPIPRCRTITRATRFGQVAGAGARCEDHRSFEVDICAVDGNCPDKERLPCGMRLAQKAQESCTNCGLCFDRISTFSSLQLRILEADFQAGMVISQGVASKMITDVHHTRSCHPPQLLNTLRTGHSVLPDLMYKIS